MGISQPPGCFLHTQPSTAAAQVKPRRPLLLLPGVTRVPRCPQRCDQGSDHLCPAQELCPATLPAAASLPGHRALP